MALGGPGEVGQQPDNTPPGYNLPDIPNPLTAIIDKIPGGKQLQELAKIMATVEDVLKSALEQGIGNHPLDIIKKLIPFLQYTDPLFSFVVAPTWESLSKFGASTLFSEYLDKGLDIQAGDLKGDGQRGVNTIDNMLSFAITVEILGAALDAFGKMALGGRWADGIQQVVGKLPETMGLSWALGMVIERAFESAIGNQLEESIAFKKRPNHPEWQIIRAGLRQHVFDEQYLRDRLAHQGFPDDVIDKLSKLADQLLPVGDLQQMYLHGIMDAGQVGKYIEKLGFPEEDASRIKELYIDKAETEASRTYVSTARSLYRNNLIDEGHYQSILEAANYPAKQIADDLAAITLEHSVGRLQLSASTIRTQLLHGTIDESTAETHLIGIGYGPKAAADTVRTWKLPPLKVQHGLSAARILSYYVSGLLDESQAREKLLDTGLRATDTDFMLAHPTATNTVHVIKLTPALITTAYVDGVIDKDQMESLLTKTGIDKNALPYYIDVAIYRKAHKHGGSDNSKPLSEGSIREAFRFGLYDEKSAVAALVHLGYSEDNAMLLLEITNKGPIVPAQPPAFPNLQAAISYMESQGYKITGPPDPRLGAAEGMLAAAGYSWVHS